MDHLYENALGRLIYQTSLILSRNLQKNLEKFDITLEQWGVLATLWATEGITFKELSEKVNKDHTNITRIVDKLEKKDLIKRSPHPEDRRASLLFVTEKGKQLREEIIPVADREANREIQGISLEEQLLLRELLARMCKNVQN